MQTLWQQIPIFLKGGINVVEQFFISVEINFFMHG